jgi:glycosyltransferase involved in cell wall biosynthesis
MMISDTVSDMSPQNLRSGRRPHYLIIINEVGFIYSHFWKLAMAIQEAGWEVTIAARNTAGAQRALDAGMNFIHLKLKIGIGNPWTELRALLAMRAAIRSCEPDVVHLVSLKNVLLGELLARKRKRTAVLGTITGLGTLFLENKLRYRILRPLVLKGMKYAFCNSRSVMAMENHDDRNFFVKKGVISEERSFVFPGAGLDINAITIAPPKNGRPVVLCVSRMLRDKGIMHLLDAARILKREGVQFDLLLVGDIDEHNPTSLTREEMRTVEADGVAKWLGHRSDVPAILHQASIVCLPSYGEGLPRSLVEASAAGLPIVTSDVPGCREVVVDGVNGRLVPPRDAVALADALRSLLRDPKTCQRMGLAARQRFEQCFTVTSVFAALNKSYAALKIPLRVQCR